MSGVCALLKTCWYAEGKDMLIVITIIVIPRTAAPCIA